MVRYKVYRVNRYHDISTGHRVVGHEGKCRHLHGHNYRIHFNCVAEELDTVGRVIDFSVVKERLCMWLEENWDHKFLAWENDPLVRSMLDCVKADWLPDEGTEEMLTESIVWVPFNPTAENMAAHLVNVVGPQQLAGTGVKLLSVNIEETRKCSASYSLE